MPRFMLGSALPPALQEEAKLADKDRFTGQHRPAWLNGPFVRNDRRNGLPDFEDDAAWLAHTEFPVSGPEHNLRLARNGQKPRTHYVRDPMKGAGDAVTAEMAEGFAKLLAQRSGLPVWVMVEGLRVGDITFNRPNTGLPHMWRVATPEGNIY